MVQILRNSIEIEEGLILETDSDEVISCDNECERNEHIMAVKITLVKPTTSVKFWLCPSFHWRSQCIEDIRGIPYEQEFFADYSLLFFSDVIQLLVTQTNRYYNQY
jgi:hypothetical protein